MDRVKIGRSKGRFLIKEVGFYLGNSKLNVLENNIERYFDFENECALGRLC